MPPQHAPLRRRCPFRASPALLLSAASALTALLRLARGTGHGIPSLDFTLSHTIPHEASVRPILEHPRGDSFAGPSAPSTGLTAGTAALGLASIVACRAKRQLSWYKKQRQNAEYQKRNPPPLLTKRELRKRVTKVKLMRRQDLWTTEFWLYIDPRDEKYQFSVQETKRWMESPDYVDEARLRDSLGIPQSPISYTALAMQKIRGERLAASGRGAPAETSEQTKKQEKKGIDLSNIDTEFLNFKGIQLTKKQKAQAAARKKR